MKLRAILLLVSLTGCVHVPPKGPVLLNEATGSFVAFFPEELERLREESANFLTQRGYSVDRTTYAAVRALALSGRTREDGPICATPTTTRGLLERLQPDVPRANVHAQCFSQPCRLSVSVFRLDEKGHSQVIGEWAADVRPPASVESFLQAVDSLAPPPPPKGGLVGGLGVRNPQQQKVRISGISTRGGWNRPPGLAELTPLQPALDRCHTTGWSFATEDIAVLSFGEGGKAQRCHLYPSRDPDEAARTTCLCDALSSLTVARGNDDRRLEVRLMNAPASTIQEKGRVAGVRVENLRSEGLEPHLDALAAHGRLTGSGIGADLRQLAQCLSGAIPETARRAPFTLQVDAMGAIVSAEVEPGEFSPETGACFQQVLAAAKLPCPDGEGAIVKGELVGWSYESR